MSKITYEKTECTRCNGTGHYSFNPIDGTLCFKCRGAKQILTAAGAKARETVEALKDEMLTIRADSVTEGQRIVFSGERKPRTIIEVKPAGTTLNRSMRNGEWVDCLILVTAGMNYSMRPDVPVRRTPTSEEWERIFDLAETLPGATVERTVTV